MVIRVFFCESPLLFPGPVVKSDHLVIYDPPLVSDKQYGV
jgi:hypothetical protein